MVQAICEDEHCTYQWDRLGEEVSFADAKSLQVDWTRQESDAFNYLGQKSCLVYLIE